MTNHKVTIFKDGTKAVYFLIGGDTFTYKDPIGNGFEVQFDRCSDEGGNVGQKFESVHPEMEHAISKN